MNRAGPVLVVCALIAPPRHARAAPDACEPSVRVSGDPDVANPIRARLAERGLGDVAAASCSPIQAHVEHRGERLQVEVTDGYGRRSHREVRDTATAIALIESWARPEVVGDQLPGAPPPAIEVASAPAVAAASVTVGATGVALIGGADYAGDGTTWARGGIAGCVALGPVCLGGRLERSRSTALSSPAGHPRATTMVAATVELPRALGRFALAPGVGIGAGWASTSGVGPHMLTEHATSVRLIATVAVRCALSRHWAVELELGGEVEATSGTTAVPGNLGRAGLGLRYGGR